MKKIYTNPLTNGVSWFTLVELIVVITILSILATIWFVSYQWYTQDARDLSRSETLNNISKELTLYIANHGKAPDVEDTATISASGVLLTYQGYFWEKAAKEINMSKTPLDPKDKELYFYALNESKDRYQIGWYFEGIPDIAYVTKSYAVDYSSRNLATTGNQLWMLFNSQNNQFISGTWVDILTTNSGTVYKMVFTKDDIVSFSWYALVSLIHTKETAAKWPCPDGFIKVPGNQEFNTDTFCVAQYEMWYSDGLTPNATDPNRNTIKYVEWKEIVSKPWVYPIAQIKQLEALKACRDMGSEFHLITNNEWMTIARNIESVKQNWSSTEVGKWNLSNGVSGDTALWCDEKGGNADSRTYVTKTWKGTSEICNKKRKHILNNGEEIWDLSGNVWEHVNKESTVTQTVVAGWTPTIAWDTDGVYDTSDMRKYGSAFWFGTSAGMWSVYATQGVANNIFLRGGSATNTTDDGVFTLFLERASTTANATVGFRCVSNL